MRNKRTRPSGTGLRNPGLGAVYTPPEVAEQLVAGALDLRIRELRGPDWPQRILSFTVVDPACGDGALLRMAAERLSAEAQAVGVPVDAVLRNLHGVDADPAAVAACDVGAVRVGESLLGVDWGRYDVVLMNPPYVKLQALRRADPAFVAALRGSDYASAQTGHVDLYLPFLELGVRLLKPGGRMGAIAPSLWIRNAYGAGLRQWVAQRACLERWVEVEGQAFPQATTYTALQFFRDSGVAEVTFEGVAGRGAVATPDGAPWTFLPDAAQAELQRIRARSRPLGEVADRIFVGVQTSADAIFHFDGVAPGRYRARTGEVLELEDAVMRPLLSGPDVGRYRIGAGRWLLMPYDGERLRAEEELAAVAPKAWGWLRRHEATLRGRERGRMDRDDRWWGFNYPKNLARQGLPKLVVAQTVPGMRVAADPGGRWTLNNVRVNAVQAAGDDLWWLLAVLNSSVVDRVFRWTARPKRGGWFEANKQFLAPLPVPTEGRQELVELGRRRHRGEAVDPTIDARVADALGVDP